MHIRISLCVLKTHSVCAYIYIHMCIYIYIYIYTTIINPFKGPVILTQGCLGGQERHLRLAGVVLLGCFLGYLPSSLSSGPYGPYGACYSLLCGLIWDTDWTGLTKSTDHPSAVTAVDPGLRPTNYGQYVFGTKSE